MIKASLLFSACAAICFSTPSSAAVIYEFESSVADLVYKTDRFVVPMGLAQRASELESCTTIFGQCSGFSFRREIIQGITYDAIFVNYTTPRGSGVTTQWYFDLGTFGRSGSYSTRFGSPQATLRVADLNAAVPEPTTWAMMLIGFGVVGGAIRSAKRRKRVVVSYA